MHVLPTGGSAAPAYNDLSGQLRVGRVARTVERQIDSAYEASRRYLARSDTVSLDPSTGDRGDLAVVSPLVVIASPILMALGKLASALTRRPRALIAARLILTYFGHEFATLMAAGCSGSAPAAGS